ncbi:hypothetical protein, conserved [Babesia bigemina]|uniref:Uncharacterized protein n=1 Tax=Babesia bigemina TaxID=5866 RepID=A0A061DBL0_BABBI|nr:hypothetical protein, conserved [Babesia bigemina]CDR97317.1 hypothetical protein, conserved [Babesia bigemina]|eukprot:XP_012769503.1 hypothetical protein, conserved [Babesia bigemina]
MKNNAGYAANGFQRSAPPQRRGPYSSSELLAESARQQDFNPISSSREMRKIMYYEHMFSKLDSQDKSKKSTSSSAQSSAGSSLEHRSRDEGEVSTSSKGASKNPKQGSARKSSAPPAAADHGYGMYNTQKTERGEKASKAEDRGSGSHQIPIEQPVKQQLMIAKRDAISIKIKTQSYKAPSTQGSQSAESVPKHETDRKPSAGGESGVGVARNLLNGVEDGASQSSSPGIHSMTDIAGTKISRLLGIDQITNSSTGLSASQRQWLVPTFDLRQSASKDGERKSQSTGFDSETRMVSSLDSSTDGESSKKGSGEASALHGSPGSARESSEIKIPRVSYQNDTYTTRVQLNDESRPRRVSRFSAPLVPATSHSADDTRIPRLKSEFTKDILPSLSAELKRDSLEAAVQGGIDFPPAPVYRHSGYRLPQAFQIKAVIPPDPASERETAQAYPASQPSDSAADTSVTAEPAEEAPQAENAAASSESHEPPASKEEPAEVKQEPASQDVQQGYELEGDQMDIIVNEEDMEIDAVMKDDVMDYDPVVKEDEDEEYIPDVSLPAVEATPSKKSTRRKVKKRKAPTPTVTPAASTPLSDAAPPSESATPDSTVAEEVYPEPPPVSRVTRTRASARNAGRRRKGGAIAQDQDPDVQPAVKTPRNASRSSGRSGSSGSRRNASESAGSKSQHHGGGHHAGGSAADRSQKPAYAASRIVSVEEAEKIMELYRQHSADLERLKKLLLAGDLAGFGREVAEQAESSQPKRTCILHPRLIVARPVDPAPAPPREQPPQNPLELSLKYRLLSKLMNK